MINPDQSVVPIKYERPDGLIEFFGGLTKREYFAGQAMLGLLGSPPFTAVMLNIKGAVQYTSNPETCATLAVMHADALLTELAKRAP